MTPLPTGSLIISLQRQTWCWLAQYSCKGWS